MQVLLRVLHSNSNVDSVNLLPVTVIGRSTECDVRLSSSHVSRKHCRFVVQENRISIEDLGSSNGTYVNDQLIEPHQAITLTPGDKVTIGPAVFVVDYEFPTYETKAGCSSSDGTHAIPVKSFGVRQDDRKSSSDNHSDKQPALNFVESHENKSGPQNSHNDQEITSNSEVGSEAGTDFDFTDDVPDQAGSPKSEIVKKGIVKSFSRFFLPGGIPRPRRSLVSLHSNRSHPRVIKIGRFRKRESQNLHQQPMKIRQEHLVLRPMPIHTSGHRTTWMTMTIFRNFSGNSDRIRPAMALCLTWRVALRIRLLH